MINICNIRLHLPAGLEGRGNNIASMLADSLVKVKVTKTIKAKNLSVSEVHATHNMLDQQIADAICAGISKKLGEAE